ncbi:follicle cell protein 3C-1, partial [Hetaerina americana]|uniref:follicle cell protein 3C-1 n=1 Tax=Hetaerina americana TaxID=62018 RepID=UPI003A7F498E
LFSKITIFKNITGLSLAVYSSILADNAVSADNKKISTALKPYVSSSKNNEIKEGELHPCVCAIFLGSQLDKNGGPPKGDPVLQHTHEGPCLPRGPVGIKMCTNKCIEMATKHLHNSKEILCAVVDRDIDREKAHLFVKNCDDKWVNTNLSSGREYCCKSGLPVPCPVKPASLLLKRNIL